MSKPEKRSEYYSKIFDTYLHFSPNYRRNLIDLNEMFDWLKEIDIKCGIHEKYDFFILMEWFNAINLIKPFCIIQYTPEMVEISQFGDKNYEELYKKKCIIFPEEIYDVKLTNDNDIQPWEYKKTQISHDIQENLKQFYQHDLIEYIYHPIQFFQVLTYLKGYSYNQIYKRKQYKKFYWRRRVEFKDYHLDILKKNLNQEKKSLDKFIQEDISNGRGFHQIECIVFSQNQWLLPKNILLWLKVESLYGPPFFRPSNNHLIRMKLHIPDFLRDRDKEFDRQLKKLNNWLEKQNDNLTNFFQKDDFYLIREFRQHTEVSLRLDGLENFIDLFLLIRSEKKRKLKGYLSYFVNMLEIVRTLRRFEGLLISKISGLAGEKKKSEWNEPKYFFESEEEMIEYIQKLYIEYGLTQKDTYVVFVEGKSDKILLKNWLQSVYSTTNVRIDIQILPGGKSSDKLFKQMINKFSANEYFLILDADKEVFIQGKKANLKKLGIDEESYFIFFPDFITANFKPTEIVQAFSAYFTQISENIRKRTGKVYEINESEKKSFLETLKKKGNEEKYEDLVEAFLRIKLNNDKAELKKPLFAQKLSDIIKLNDRKKYLFKDILGKFFNKIQMKTFPDDLKKMN
ncbi:MAG: TOPRIM nucleotidyl transferase/hydrolase domain-containing protein [Promethearchaeota archaeon]